MGTPKAQGWPKLLTASTLRIRMTIRRPTGRPIAGCLTDYAKARIRNLPKKFVGAGRAWWGVGDSQGGVGNEPALFVPGRAARGRLG